MNVSGPPTPPDSGSELVKLSFDGDVILEPSGGGEDAIRLLCSSTCLRHGSPVFRAMFRPDTFAEGENLSSDSPRVVPLPEDDPKAMKKLCEILHLQVTDEQLDITKTVPFLADFAIVVEKYQCQQAAATWASNQIHAILSYRWDDKTFWSSKHKEEQLESPVIVPLHCWSNFEKLIFVAYALDLPELFRNITKQLTVEYVMPSDGISIVHSPLMPPAFVQDFEKYRQGEQESIVLAMYAHATSPAQGLVSDHCGLSQIVAKVWLGDLTAVDLARLDKVSITTICTRAGRLKNLPFVVNNNAQCYWTDSHSCFWLDFKTKRTSVVAKVQSIASRNRGQCLDCIKRRYLGIDSPCRIRHNSQGERHYVP